MSYSNYGRVRWFNDKKGYGFIVIDNDDEDVEYFVHFSNILSDNNYKTLEDGQAVKFDLENTEKGVQAVNVVVIE